MSNIRGAEMKSRFAQLAGFALLASTILGACGGGDSDNGTNSNNSSSRTPNFATGSDAESVEAMTITPDQLGAGFATVTEESFDKAPALGGAIRKDSGQISNDFVYYSMADPAVGGADGFTAGFNRHITAPTTLDAEDIKASVGSFEAEGGARDSFVGLQYWGANQQNQWFDNCTEDKPADIPSEEYRLCSEARKANGMLRHGRYIAFISFTGTPGPEFDSVIAETLRIQAENMQGYE